MKIYTRTGDDGNTSLSGGERIPKYHPRVEAYGSVDELISWIGLLRDLKENFTRKDRLLYIQEQLMKCVAALAAGNDKVASAKILPDENCILFLEEQIDKLEEKLPPLKKFIIPGGNISVSYCHIARCVCRRAERAVLRLGSAEKIPESVPVFLNRLSDYLFVLARIICHEADNQ